MKNQLENKELPREIEVPKTGVKESLLKDTKGLSTVEYIIILVLIAVAGITVWSQFGKDVTDQVDKASKKIEGMK